MVITPLEEVAEGVCDSVGDGLAVVNVEPDVIGRLPMVEDAPIPTQT